MTVRARLILTIVGISALLTVPAIYGASKLKTLREIADNQRTGVAKAFRTLGKLQTALAELDRYERSYIVTRGADQKAGIDQSLADVRAQLKVLQENYPAETKTASAHFDSIEEATRNVIGMVTTGRNDEATAYFDRVKPLLVNADRSIDAIAAAIDAQSLGDAALAHRISGAARTTTLLALLLALSAVFTLGYWTTHALTSPLRRLRRAIATVASGEFVEPENLPYQRDDEIGDLARSFGWMTQRLSQLDKMKAEFIGIATHELKTPINVITGYTELVEEGLYGTLNLEQTNAMRAIAEQSHVLTRLVNQLLDISRLEAGGLQLDIGDVVIEDLIASLDRSFSILARKKNIELEFVKDESTPRTIPGDAERLRDQVLGNLLSNALKFTPEQGRITVRTWGAEGGLQLEVSDSGVGIPAEQIPYVFDKYYQIGQQARSKGVGLGLAIAKEVVEAHGGKIWIDTARDSGITFRITIPREAVKPAQPQQLAPEASDPSGSQAARRLAETTR